MAQQEDFEEREAELAEKEERLEGLEDKLLAKNEERLKQLERDLRREMGLDTVAKPTEVSEKVTTVESIEAKYEELMAPYKGSGNMREVARLKTAMRAEIEEAKQQQ